MIDNKTLKELSNPIILGERIYTDECDGETYHPIYTKGSDILTTDELASIASELLERRKADDNERQFSCRKCGMRQELGTKKEATF